MVPPYSSQGKNAHKKYKPELNRRPQHTYRTPTARLVDRLYFSLTLKYIRWPGTRMRARAQYGCGIFPNNASLGTTNDYK